MLQDIEIIIRQGESLSALKRVRPEETIQNSNPQNTDFDCYICQDKRTGRYYFIYPSEYSDDDFAELNSNREHYEVFKIKYSNYCDRISSNVSDNRSHAAFEVKLAALSDGTWQAGSQLAAGLAQSSHAANVSLQLGFPAVLGAITAVLRGCQACRSYRKTHGELPPEVRNSILKDSAAFAAKSAVAMGAWELGLFVGRSVATACSLSPVSLWVPVILSIGAGLFQGISAVATTIADEKRKYGQVRSSALSLAGTFVSNFVSGAVWQMCSYIPFGSLLAKKVLKPVAQIVGSILVGAASFVATYLINKLSAKKVSFFKQAKTTDQKTPEAKPSSRVSRSSSVSSSSQSSDMKEPLLSEEPVERKEGPSRRGSINK